MGKSSHTAKLPSRSPGRRTVLAAALQRWTIRLGWLLLVPVTSSAVIGYADENGSRAFGRENAVGQVVERAGARPPRFIIIPDATGPRLESGRPNYTVIALSFGLSEELSSLLANFSTADGLRGRAKPQEALAGHFLNKAVELVPFLSDLRDHIPKGVKFKIDIHYDGVAIDITVPLAALAW